MPGGHDHRTFRLGDELSVRLPSGDWYALQVDKEQRWLPVLAPHLPLEIPSPVARGVPGEGYPFEWSMYRWLEGEPASAEAIRDPVGLAVSVAGFLRALAAVPADGGPGPGRHSFHRGGLAAVRRGRDGRRPRPPRLARAAGGVPRDLGARGRLGVGAAAGLVPRRRRRGQPPAARRAP